MLVLELGQNHLEKVQRDQVEICDDLDLLLGLIWVLNGLVSQILGLYFQKYLDYIVIVLPLVALLQDMVWDVVEVKVILIDYALLSHRVDEILDHCKSCLHFNIFLFLKSLQVAKFYNSVHAARKLTEEVVDNFAHFSVVCLVITVNVVVILALNNLFLSYVE